MVKRKTPTASELIRRDVGDDPEFDRRVEYEVLNARIAQIIHDGRTAMGLTQRELAVLVGTSQSAISRLEDADYEGHSIPTLERIAMALGQRLEVRFAPREGAITTRTSRRAGYRKLRGGRALAARRK